MTHSGFDNLVRQGLKANTPMQDALGNLAEILNTQNKEVFGNLFQKKRKIQGRIEGIQRQLKGGGPRYLLKLERKLQNQLDDVLHQIELFWFQKSQIEYIRDGDRNTRFFHLNTIVRRRINRIEGLQLTDGTWVIEAQDLKIMVLDFLRPYVQRKQAVRMSPSYWITDFQIFLLSV